MKKYSIFFILVFFLFIGNVKAELTGTIVHIGGTVNIAGGNTVFYVTDTLWDITTCRQYGASYCKRAADGSEAGSGDGKYFVHLSVEKYNFVTDSGTYPAFCIDPGSAPATDVTCSKVPDSSEVATIKKIIKDKGNPSGVDLVVVNVAIKALAAKLGLPTSTPANGVAAMANLQISNGGGVYDAAKAWAANGPNGSILAQAQGLIDGGGAGMVDGGDFAASSYNFTFTQSNKNGKEITFRVTSDIAVPNDVTFSCKSNCTLISGTMTKGSKNGTVKIRVNDSSCPTDFDYVIQYKFQMPEGTVSGGSSLFKCVSNNSAGQAQAFLVSSESPDEDEYVGTVTKRYSCTDECKRDLPTTPSVRMCCDDGTKSSVYEPFIKDLFCDTHMDGVNVIGNRPSDQADSSYKEKIVNTYCKTYCTERIIVEQPGGISVGRNGKYFTISGGPTFTGYKTCRIITDYKKWQKNYTDETVRAKGYYNTYQEKMAEANTYRQAYEEMTKPARTSKTVTGTASYSGDCSGSECDGTCEAEEDYDCDFTYQYDMDTYTYKTYTYTKIKITYDGGKPINQYNGLKIETNGTDSKTGSSSGYLDANWDDDDCGAASSMTGTGQCDYWVEEEVDCDDPDETGCTDWVKYTEDLEGSVPYTGIDREFGKSNTSLASQKSKWTTPEGAATSAASSYATSVGKIDQLEKDLKQCNIYYEAGGDGHAPSNYDFQPTAEFRYVKVYVSSSSDPPVVTSDTDGTSYDVSCTSDNAVVGTGGETDENGVSLGLNAKQYNTGVNHVAKVYNFINAAVLCNVTGDKASTYGCAKTYTGNLSNREYEQKYVTDAYYKRICTSSTGTQDYYTLYPFGGISYEQSIISVKHNTQYYVEYSALYGQFLTYWRFSGLGTRGKFNSYFASGQTCTSDPEDISEILHGSPGLTCHYTVESELSRISGCDQGAIISHLTYNRGRCCTGSCIYTGEDELTYSFKTVDSAKLFPDGGVMSKSPNKDYAYNWLRTADGPSVMGEIQRRASQNDKVFSEERVSYEFNLDVQDLTLIKSYNKSNAYNDFRLKCRCSDDNNIKETCSSPNHLYKCYSDFLNKMMNKRLPGITQRLTGKNYLRHSNAIHYSS